MEKYFIYTNLAISDTKSDISTVTVQHLATPHLVTPHLATVIWLQYTAGDKVLLLNWDQKIVIACTQSTVHSRLLCCSLCQVFHSLKAEIKVCTYFGKQRIGSELPDSTLICHLPIICLIWVIQKQINVKSGNSKLIPVIWSILVIHRQINIKSGFKADSGWVDSGMSCYHTIDAVQPTCIFILYVYTRK